MKDYSKIIKYIKQLSSECSIVSGYADLHQHPYVKDEFLIKDFGLFTIICGDIPEDEVKECFIHRDWIKSAGEEEGCYRFDAAIKYQRPEYGDYGRVIDGDCYYIDYISLEFDHSFIQRERDAKLDGLLGIFE